MKENVKIIGIVASFQEDAVAIGELLDGDVIVKRYRDEIRKITARALGVNVEQMEDEKFIKSYMGDEWSYIRNERFVENEEINIRPMKYHITPEHIFKRIQYLGREIHSNFWVNMLFASAYPDEPRTWLVTDVIFPNEVDGIIERDGIVVTVRRPNYPGDRRLDYLNAHPGIEKKYTTDGSKYGIKVITDDLRKYLIK